MGELVLRPKGKLTAAWLTRVEVPEGVARVTVKDDVVRGLELRLSSTGARAWALSRRVNGRQRRFTIPKGEKLSLAEARAAGEKLAAEISSGRDPVEERRAARRKAKTSKGVPVEPDTLSKLLDAFEKAVALPKGQRSWDARRAHIESEYRAHLDKPLAAITPPVVRSVLDAAAARGAPVSGRHGLRYIKRVLSWALRRGLVVANAAVAVPMEEVDDIVRREARRDRVLDGREVGALWRALEAVPADPYAGVLQLALLTGQRRGELAGLRWADVDAERREWRQETNKSDRPHVVPLSPAALKIIEAQPKPKGREFVFNSSGAGSLSGPRGNWSRAVRRYSADASVTGWTIHDLRRTAATLMASLKIDRGIVEMILNHSESAGRGSMVASIYNRYSYEMEKRTALEKLADHIAFLASNEGAQILPLKQTASG